MKAGRELDALIAEKVMGIEPHIIGIENMMIYLPYSTDISAAWEVVEKMISIRPEKEPNAEFALVQRSKEWLCGYELYESWYCSASALTAPHAICLAALKAVGYEEKL